jgi:hypothetical protein
MRKSQPRPAASTASSGRACTGTRATHTVTLRMTAGRW